MRPARLLLALIAAASLGVVALSAPAYGLSCVDPGSLVKRAPSIFTGTITDVHDERLRVEVQEIWKGKPVDREVWVDLDPDLKGWWDMFEGGYFPEEYSSTTTWLFAPHTTKHGEPVVNACTAWDSTEPWGQEIPHGAVTRPVEDLAPAASPVVPVDRSQDADGNAAWLFGGAVAVALVVGGASYRLVRRRSS